MSDTAPTTTPDAPATPAPSAPEGVTPGAPAAPAAPEGTPAPAAAAAEAGNQANAEAALAGDDGALAALPESWQKEVRKLRSEAAESRTKVKRYEEPFSALEENERDWMLSLARDLGDPEKQTDAARRMKATADLLLEGITDPAELEEAANKPLTMADLERLEAERAAKRDEEASIQAIFTEAEELGYKKDTPDFALLMWLSANADEPSLRGDLKAAHKRIEDGRQAIIDGWVEQQKAKGANFVTVAGGTGGAPSGQAQGAKTIAEASQRARARAVAAQAAAARAGA